MAVCRPRSFCVGLYTEASRAADCLYIAVLWMCRGLHMSVYPTSDMSVSVYVCISRHVYSMSVSVYVCISRHVYSLYMSVYPTSDIQTWVDPYTSAEQLCVGIYAYWYVSVCLYIYKRSAVPTHRQNSVVHWYLHIDMSGCLYMHKSSAVHPTKGSIKS